MASSNQGAADYIDDFIGIRDQVFIAQDALTLFAATGKNFGLTCEIPQ